MLRMSRVLAISVLGVALSTAPLAACVGDDPTPTASSDDAATTLDGASAADGGSDAPALPDAAPDAATFCSARSKPAGVADFLCADFDEGAIEKGWTSAAKPDAGAGVLEATTSFFFSPPRGLLAEALTTATGDRGVWLLWTAGGASKVKTVTVDVKVNPNVDANAPAPQTGYVEIVGVDFPDGNVSIRYTDGRAIEGSPYSGYYVYGLYDGGGAIELHRPLTTAPPRNAWTALRLFVTFPTTGTDGFATVTYNGVPILTNAVMPTRITTSVGVRVGAKASGQMERTTPHRFDDVLVEVVRE